MVARMSAKPKETALYPPLKAFLETQGYEVKAEIGAADMVAMRGDEPPMIIELKTGFSLSLFHQAIARQSQTDNVYVAVPRGKGKAFWRSFKSNLGLARRLGLGLFLIRMDDGFVELRCEPAPFMPRKSKVKLARLMREFDQRDGDPNLGGSTRTTLVTAYRQDAQHCADYLAFCGSDKGAQVAKATGVQNATAIMAANHYGWFQREARGIYGLTDLGKAAAKSGE